MPKVEIRLKPLIDSIILRATELYQRPLAVTHPHRHGRARPGHPRLLMWNGLEDVDARNKCGHDELEIVAVGIRLSSLAQKWRAEVTRGSPQSRRAVVRRLFARELIRRPIDRRDRADLGGAAVTDAGKISIFTLLPALQSVLM